MSAPVQLPTLTVPKPGEQGEWVVPDPDMYILVLSQILEIRNKTYKGRTFDDKYQVRFEIKVADPDSGFDDVAWRQWFGYSLHDLAPLKGILLAIRGNKPFDPDKPVELTHYLNKPFRGMVEVDEVPARDDPSRTLRFAKLTKALPLKASKEDVEAAKAEAAGDANPFEVGEPGF